MHQELKLVISDSKRIIETISKQTVDTSPATMVKALNEFRLLVNTAISKLIEDPEGACDFMEEDEGDDTDEEDIDVSPKKRKK